MSVRAHDSMPKESPITSLLAEYAVQKVFSFIVGRNAGIVAGILEARGKFVLVVK